MKLNSSAMTDAKVVHRTHCALCGGTSFTPVRPHREFSGTSIVRCDTCKLLFTNPAPTAEALHSLYAQAVWNAKDFDVSATLPASQIRFIQSADSLFPHCGKVLDIGCGTGKLLNLFQLASWEVVGIEPNEGAASYARDKFKINVQSGTLSDAVCQTHEFDLICLSHVLEHLEDPISTVQEIRRILKKDGLLFIEVPNENEINCKGTTGYHLFFFSPQTLSAVLTRSGFQPVRLATNGKLLADYQRLSRITYSRLGKTMRRIPIIVKLIKYLVGGLLAENDQLDDYYPTTGNRQGAAIRGLFRSTAGE